MFNRKEIKAKAKELFKNNYWKCVLVALIGAVIAGTIFSSSGLSSLGNKSTLSELSDIFSPQIIAILLGIMGTASIFSLMIQIFAFNPLKVSCNSYFINNHFAPASLAHLGDGFSKNYIGNVKTMFLMQLYTLLWSLLFIIPGIVKSYEYRMIPYLIAEDPNMTTQEAFARSKKMMTGNKWAAFVLDLSFIGWYFLECLTCGIVGIFWVNPYVDQTNAELYIALGGTEGNPSYARIEYDQTAYERTSYTSTMNSQPVQGGFSDQYASEVQDPVSTSESNGSTTDTDSNY